MSRDKHSRVEELENQLLLTRMLARRLWITLASRIDVSVDVFFGGYLHPDARRVLDPAFDAAEIVWERHRVLIEPCRRILDGVKEFSLNAGPVQEEMYVGRWPGGDSRNLTRAQLMMMAGQDADA